MFKFDEDFIKNYDEDSNKRYIREVDVEYPKNLHGDFPFLAEIMKINKHKKFYVICMIKNNILFT